MREALTWYLDGKCCRYDDKLVTLLSDVRYRTGGIGFLQLEAATGAISTVLMSKHEWLDARADNVSKVQGECQS